MEFGDAVLGESVRGEWEGAQLVGLAVDFDFDVNVPESLDQLTKNPLLCESGVETSLRE